MGFSARVGSRVFSTFHQVDSFGSLLQGFSARVGSRVFSTFYYSRAVWCAHSSFQCPCGL